MIIILLIKPLQVKMAWFTPMMLIKKYLNTKVMREMELQAI